MAAARRSYWGYWGYWGYWSYWSYWSYWGLLGLELLGLELLGLELLGGALPALCEGFVLRSEPPQRRKSWQAGNGARTAYELPVHGTQLGVAPATTRRGRHVGEEVGTRGRVEQQPPRRSQAVHAAGV